MIKTNNTVGMLCSLFLLLLVSSCNQSKETEPKDLNPKTAKIVLPDGFVAEHLYSPSDNEEGSWVAMTFDDKGRMITSDQYGGLFRIELPPIGSDTTVKLKVEKLELPSKEEGGEKPKIGYAHGLLWAYNSLYMMVAESPGSELEAGLYRLQDLDNDDKLDKMTKMLPLKGGGEHGPHSIVLGPDSSVYIVAGNHTDLPKMDAYRLPPTWKRDNLFPHILDPQGHATDRLEPGGWIAKTDAEGSKWELVSAGYRNPYDIAFNDDGELFTYDADMEWDFGLPWYRPTRICHVTSGSEFGWRTGNAKWSPSYLDNLPATLNIGQGSPTNLLYAGSANFPDNFRNSLLAFDWSFGIIYSIKLTPEGATYSAKAEEFLSGAPLPLTDGEIGHDGALYFLTGGRRLESDLYRVYHKDHQKIAKKSKTNKSKVSDDIKLRREIEQYHVASAPGTAEKMWDYLGHKDRFIRYAARIAIEHQPVDSWKDLVFAEKDVTKLTGAALALVRAGGESFKEQILTKLTKDIVVNDLSKEALQDLLRVYEVAIFRMGKPDAETKNLISQQLSAKYPSNDNLLDRELVKVLVSIDDDAIVSKVVAALPTLKDNEKDVDNFMNSADLILRNPQYGLDIADMLANIPPAQQIYLATMLSAAETGWTKQNQDEYFKWYHTAFGYKGGNSYIGFIDKARKMALQHVPKDQFAYFNKLSGDSLIGQSGNRLAEKVEGPKGPGQKWEIDSALKVINENSGERDFKRGRELFIAVKCGSCHTMKGEGGSVGPDLTQLGTRFSTKDMLEAIIEPNKVISDQYESKVFHLKDGTSVLGRLMGENDKNYIISQNPYAPQVTRDVKKNQVVDIKVSEVSIMPPGSLNMLNADELKNIMAYLMSGANENHELYQKK
ncbi:c-type cytochrome [Sphingobacterium sp. UT-1RO-CII-1]|uniref:c-type cytochrome n=1 Tax=Sphingobacterium sp. UT-1RO-CII-1 TaxID=2995225 RepID=UPI00227CA59C|nr:c-type cytochrome [Sphingobacterium sp. UT-1RO-CII-1]MCY4778361.1 c-type cytochrome [Sphingobacterium sp. UT-1RO-CII-1]